MDANADVSILDYSWLWEMKKTALMEYHCLQYIQSHCDAKSIELLHEAVGYHTVHSLKLKAFVELFCDRFLVNPYEFHELDAQGIPTVEWSCGNPSACVMAVLRECNRNKWSVKTSL